MSTLTEEQLKEARELFNTKAIRSIPDQEDRVDIVHHILTDAGSQKIERAPTCDYEILVIIDVGNEVNIT